MALACEKPEAVDLPVSSCTPRELADEAVKRGIVTQISPRTVERFLTVRAKGAGEQQQPSAPLTRRDRSRACGGSESA